MAYQRFEGVVQQDAYAPSPEDTLKPVRLNPRGELVVPDWMTQLALDGRVFNISNLTIETVALGSTSFADTDPFILVDVPTGTTIIPLEVLLAQGGTVAGGVITVLITTDDGLRFSSGGTAVTPINLRKDDPITSATSAYVGDATAIVAAANVDADTIWAGLLDQDVTDPNSTENVIWTARNYIPPILIGPASLLIFAFAATTAPGLFWSVKWAEIPTVSVT